MEKILLLLVITVARCQAEEFGKVEQDPVDDLFTLSFIPTALQVPGISPNCIRDSRIYAAAFFNQSKWAITMYESSGKLPASLVYGQVRPNSHHSPGIFDECLSVWTDSPTSPAKYCTVFFGVEVAGPGEIDHNNEDPSKKEEILIYGERSRKLKKAKTKETDQPANAHIMMPSVGLCVPASCSAADLRSAVANLRGLRTIGPRFDISLVTITDDRYCYTRKDVNETEFDIGDKSMIVLIGVLIFLVVCATIHEAWSERTGKTTDDDIRVRTLRCFSALSNGRALLSMSGGDASLSCLHGIRVLTTFWVVISHLCQQTVHRMSFNKGRILEFAAKPLNQVFNNNYVSVDTFFLMSGLLVSYTLLRDLDRSGGRFNVSRFYLHRYFRLTPVYIFVLAFFSTLSVHLGKGPNWDYVHRMRDGCRRDWWTNMLYINNHLPGDQRFIENAHHCMTESWYLACDMQMFLVSPLLVYPLWRYRRAGMLWNLLVLVASLAVTAVIYVAWDLPPSILPTRLQEMATKFDTYIYKYYAPMYTRIPPYLLGILIGHFLHRTSKRPIKLSRFTVMFGWAASAVVSIGIMYALIPFLDEETAPEIDLTFRVLYGTFHRLLWGAAVGWVIVACAHGYGGIANSILSWKAFVPLGRLTYVVHLINYSVAKVYFSQRRHPIYAAEADQLVTSFGLIVTNFLISAIITPLVEMPGLNLDKLFFGPKKMSTGHKDTAQNGCTKEKRKRS